jgi:hypothetical protein
MNRKREDGRAAADAVRKARVRSGGNYLRKFARMVERGELPANVGIQHVEISHDSWCAHFKGRPCNCDPVIVYHGEEYPRGDKRC